MLYLINQSKNTQDITIFSQVGILFFQGFSYSIKIILFLNKKIGMEELDESKKQYVSSTN